MKISEGLRVYAVSALSCVVAMVAMTGCALHDRVVSVDNTFIPEVDASKKIDNIPYAHAWVNPDFDGRKYSKLLIKPVRTDQLPEGEWSRSASPVLSSEEDYFKLAGEIAVYFREQLIKDISSYDGNRLVIVDEPGPDVLTLEIAFTQLEFSHPLARAAALAAPIPGTGVALSEISDPHVAFAARITDPSGQLVATAADRKFPPMRLIDLNKLTVSSSAREVCGLWAETMAEALNKGRFAKTSGNWRFSLLPW